MKWQRVKYQPNTPLGANGQKVTASKAHTELSKQAAKEGMVLLKNENSLLPFEKGTRLAVFGKASADYVKGGGGSGDVTVSYEAMEKKGKPLAAPSGCLTGDCKGCDHLSMCTGKLPEETADTGKEEGR